MIRIASDFSRDTKRSRLRNSCGDHLQKLESALPDLIAGETEVIRFDIENPFITGNLKRPS